MTNDELDTLLRAPLAADGFDLFDVVASGLGTSGATVQVFVDLTAVGDLGPEVSGALGVTPAAPARIDLEGVSRATRIVSALLDDGDPIVAAYTLEVSSPGLERALRTPAHFGRFVGAQVAIKTRPDALGDRRVEGLLDHADAAIDGGIRIGDRTIAYGDIERARTVFVWGPTSKPGSGSKPGGRAKQGASANATGATTPGDGPVRSDGSKSKDSKRRARPEQPREREGVIR